MKLNFCTLFNSYYLTRGLAMYQSLLKHNTDFHLYIFAFDTASYEYLHAKMLKNVTVISLSEFEDEELLKIKPTRTAGEYCWTCTPSTIYYCIEKYKLENCTYIDADLLFYSNPEVLVEEMGENSVLITDHRYTPEYDQTATSGKYCVQFVTFKNDERGLIVLKWWREACIEWCYNRMEPGKFGDQKYLDDWTTRFEGVHELQHLGGGVAPWNVQQYRIKSLKGKLFVKEIKTGNHYNLIFFHFHGVRFYFNKIILLTDNNYEINKNISITVHKSWQDFFYKYINNGTFFYRI